MPSRVIRGEILASRSLGRVSRDADAFFWRLLMAADDFGRLDGRLGVLRAVCYPNRDEVCTGEIERWLEELATCDPGSTGPVQLYEVDGEPFVQLRNWERHRSNSKRAITSRFPDPRENPGESRGIPDLPKIPTRLTSDVLRVTSDECLVARGVPGTPPAAPAEPQAAREARAPRKRKEPKPVSDPPEQFSPEDLTKLREWCERTDDVRGQAGRVAALAEQCLDHHRRKGLRSADWLASARTWIRNDLKFNPVATGPPKAPEKHWNEKTPEERRASIERLQEVERKRMEHQLAMRHR